MDCRRRASAGGFTIVELIAVLLMLGILSTVAMSRMVKGSAYTPSLVVQEVIALTRFGQQLAMSRQDATVSMEMQQIASDWRFRVRADNGTGAIDARVQATDRSNSSVTVINGAMTMTLAADPLVLTFDGMGNLSAAAVGATVLNAAVGVQLTVLGDSSRTVCVSSTGYAYRDACA